MEAHGLALDDALALEVTHYDDDPAVRPGWWELVSLTALVIAGIGLPVVGWLVGITMVHLSDVWTARDKRIATIAGLTAVTVVVVGSAFTGDTGVILLDLGPPAVLILLGGAVAGIAGGAYLIWRAFELV
jgi:hypothetical protein